MDILNFISWIKGGRVVTTLDPTQALLPIGQRDSRRDDGYLTNAITVADLLALVPTPPSGLEGTSFVLVKGEGTVAENGVELQAAYDAAQLATPYGNPLSSTNRFTILVAPGDYYSTSTYGQFVINTNYVDIVSLSGLLDVYLSGTSVGATDVYLKGLSTRKATDIGGTTTAFNLAAYGVNQTFDTCGGGANSFGFGGTSTGKFINCIAGNDSFCSAPTSSSPPNIVNLGSAANAAGTYINCTAGFNSFGVATLSAIASGTFTNCTALDFSFGAQTFISGGTASGIFTNCKGTDNVFGAGDGVASGNFTDCTANGYAFGGGYNGSASGIFNNCVTIGLSFGGYKSANGTFNNCIGGSYSFGNYGVSTGTFNNCIAGEGCFDTAGPLITRKLYYCRLTIGEFKAVTGTGLTRYCLDGNNVANNQG